MALVQKVCLCVACIFFAVRCGYNWQYTTPWGCVDQWRYNPTYSWPRDGFSPPLSDSCTPGKRASCGHSL